MRERDGLSAGGSRIRTIGPACKYTARSESAATLALKSWPCFVTIIRTRVAIDAISHQWPGRPLAGMLGKAIRKRFCSRCCRVQLARQGTGDVPGAAFRLFWQ